MPLLDTTSALKQTVLSRETLNSLPVAHDVWSIARLVPGVQQTTPDVGGRNMPDGGTMLMHGSIDREEGYWIDGLDVTSPVENGLQFRIDTFGASEVNVQAGRTQADTERGGVQMNIITKTGTNTIAGGVLADGATHRLESNNVKDSAIRSQLLAGVPPKALAANPNITVGSNTPRIWDAGLNLGGPDLRDRVWFFGSSRESQVYRKQVGSYNADGTQLLDENTMQNLLGKLSWQVTRNGQLHALIDWSRKFRPHQNTANATPVFRLASDVIQRRPNLAWDLPLHADPLVADGARCRDDAPCGIQQQGAAVRGPEGRYPAIRRGHEYAQRGEWHV